MALMTELKWALVFALVMLLWMSLERLVGLHDLHIDKHMILTNFFAIPAIAVYIFALRDKRASDFCGVMTYGQGVRSGLLMTVIITILAPGLQWVISTLITPHYFTNAISFSVATGFHEDRAAAEAFFNLRQYMIQSAIGAFVMGALTTLAVAYFLRTKPKSP